MEDQLGVDKFMGPIGEAIKRHIEGPSDAYTDIYNRAWEAVYNALSSQRVNTADAESPWLCKECGAFNRQTNTCRKCNKMRR